MTDLNAFTNGHQPGDNLPSNGLDFEPADHGISLDDIWKVPQSPFRLQDERDLAMTRLLALQIERGALKTQVEEQEELIASLRETLDAVRRDLAAARLKLEHQPAQQPDGLTTLLERVDDLEEIVYPMREAQAQPVSGALGKEVQTLVQNIKSATDRENADLELTEKLNLGWEILHINAARNDGLDFTTIWRVVTLVRDVPEPAAGDDGHAEADAPAGGETRTDPLVAVVIPGTKLGWPPVQTFNNRVHVSRY